MLGCRPSARLARRVERGVRAYREGMSPLLLLSGGGAGAEPEAHVMRRIALAAGAPEAALLLEADSRDTLENASECARLLRERGLRRIALVTDRTHLARARLMFRRAGLEVVARLGVPSRSWKAALRAGLYEAAALPCELFRRRPPRSRG